MTEHPRTTNLTTPTDRGYKNPTTGTVDIWADVDINKITLFIKNNSPLADQIADAYKKSHNAEIRTSDTNPAETTVTLTFKRTHGDPVKWHGHALTHEEKVTTEQQAKKLDLLLQGIQKEFFPKHEVVHARTIVHSR